MSNRIVIVSFVICLCLATLMDLCAAGGKGGGSNIVLHGQNEQIIVHSGGKKGGENIVIREHKKCCHKKIRYIPVYYPVHEHHGWGHQQHHKMHEGWGWGF
ncbi:uncharacterized protein LOC141849426 [Brevipalpus obovatus]|uniref:uncharacterized protein LOC141849426 n=1 Tax=Brevipalpus obovatus TaxID=246614 RepID=UPI003D9F1C08